MADLRNTEAPGTTGAPAESASGVDATTEAQSPQAALGNTGVAARATGVEPQPEGETNGERDANPTTTEVQTALNATPFVATAVLEQIARLAHQHANWPANCWNTPAVMTLMGQKFNGDQMYRALSILNQPAGDARANAWLTHIRAASTAVAAASASSVQAVVSGATAAALDLVLADAANMAWLRVRAQIEPLSIFRTQQAFLTASAVASAEFVAWMVAASAPAQVLRAATGASRGVRTALAAALDAVPGGGWGWLAGVSGPNLTPTQRTALGTLRAATTNAAAQARIDAITALSGPSAAQATLSAELTRLQAAGNASPGPVLAAIQVASTAERLAAVDSASAGYVFTVCPGSPLLIWNVAAGDRLAFLGKGPFVRQCLTRLPFSECLPLLSERSIIARVGPILDTYSADFATWIAAMPPKAQLSDPEQMSIRALRLVITNAANSAAIGTKLADRNSAAAHAHRSATAIPGAVYTSPLARLDALLAQATPAARQVISYCGALGGDRSTVIADSTRLASLRTKLAPADLHQALIALQTALPFMLGQLLQVPGIPPHLLVAAVAEAPLVARAALTVNEALLTQLIPLLPVGQVSPLTFVGFHAGDLPADALDGAAFRGWVLSATLPALLITRLFGTAARVARWTPKLDSNGGMAALLPRIPTGAALLPAERTALEAVHTASASQATKTALRAILDSATDRVATTAEGRDALIAELAVPTPSAEKVVRLAIQVTDAAERATIMGSHRAALVRVLGAAQLLRVLTAWGQSFATRLGWIADYAAPPSSVLELLLSNATAAEQHAILDNARIVTRFMATNILGPVETLPALRTAHAAVVDKPEFWRWVKHRQMAVDVLRLLGTVPAARIAPAVVALKASAGGLSTFDSLPRGTGLTLEYRRWVDLVVENCNDLDAQNRLFLARFGITAVAAWSNGTATAGSLLALYRELASLPIAHVANNPTHLQRITHRSGAGGMFDDPAAEIGDNITANKTLYEGTPQAHTERYFDHTVRHEIGHSVDAMLGERTDLVFTTAGWQQWASTEFDGFATAFDAFDPQGGAAPNAADQAAIKAAVVEYLHSGSRTIEGPSQPFTSLVGPSHAVSRFPHVKIVQQLSAGTPGMSYTNRYDDGSSVWSLNFYYRRFMKCNTAAGRNVPRDYTMFAPAEWFADMYAEYYRSFDGVNDSTLGGNCPAYVKTWFFQNVHRIGGRTPSDLNGRALPPGQRAHL